MESAPALIALPTARLVTWTWRPEDGRLVVPPNADTALGAELAAALTQPDWGFVHPDDVAGLDTALQRCLRDNEPIEQAVRVHPDLRSPVTWLEVHATCAETADGPQLRGVMLDGTRRRLAESARERQEARYRLIMDSAREYAILTMDRGGRITGWSVGAARVVRLHGIGGPRPGRPRPSSRPRMRRPASRSRRSPGHCRGGIRRTNAGTCARTGPASSAAA